MKDDVLEAVLAPLLDGGELREASAKAVREQMDADKMGVSLPDALERFGVPSAKVARALALAIQYPLYPHTKSPAEGGDVDGVPDSTPDIRAANPRWLICSNEVAYIANPFDNALHTEVFKYADENGIDLQAVGVIDRTILLNYAERAEPGLPAENAEAARASAEDDASAKKDLDSILNSASQANASDIHFEPENGATRVRMRIDGTLRVVKSFEHSAYLRVTNVILSRCNQGKPGSYSEALDDKFIHRLPSGRKVKFRVMMLPGTLSEHDTEYPNLVLRLLGNTTSPIGIKDLGLPDAENNPQLTIIRMFCERKNGIILVSGPTGSGKTTTLTAIQAEMLRQNPDKKFWTAEDPVEISQAGVQQVQINEKSGITFARCLKSFLRGDPDVILVGEIRDKEVANLALTAAITGHLVFSTIHTNSAIEAISRLINIECDPFIVGSALKAVTAQRLVKKVCEHCRVQAKWGDLVSMEHPMFKVNQQDELMRRRYEKMEKLYADLDDYPEHDQTVYLGRKDGCAKCNNRGYKGRILISEVFQVSQASSKLITERRPIAEIREHAVLKEGYKEMWQHGMSLISAGETTFDEVVAGLGDREKVD